MREEDDEEVGMRESQRRERSQASRWVVEVGGRGGTVRVRVVIVFWDVWLVGLWFWRGKQEGRAEEGEEYEDIQGVFWREKRGRQR